ncbi:hypothetical protein NUW54_g4424 [Trametes sanguinea]|uniref:Uncharacterized protein n=1 Tax=Trametes sanguinea TaxID=158606 RepID=A0ACC1Q0R6_9APHY|nr:hypothetical protein NUW54_g4424 [Trametes sanguinea]
MPPPGPRAEQLQSGRTDGSMARDTTSVHQQLAQHSWGAAGTAHRRELKHKRLVKAAQTQPYWLKITLAQEKLRTWSSTELIRYLQLTDNQLFAGLHVATLAKWIVDDGNGKKTWSAPVLERANAGRCHGTTTRSKTLSKYPLIVSDAASQLKALRVAGVAVNGPLVAAMIKAHICHKAPELLAPGSKFTLSTSCVHRFVQEVLDWSSRKSTQAARKVPVNGADLCELAFLRMVFAIAFHRIKPSMIVNADQAGISLMPSGKQTYEVRGSKDVTVHAHDEKRQMTVVVASSLSGEILPFQLVWGGTTDVSLPSKLAPHRQEADELGFVYAHGDTRHWSSKETTKKWIAEVLDPYFDRQREQDEELSDNSKGLLVIDVWPVHIAKSLPDDFLPWMRVSHKNMIIIFIPGGCTGFFQPVDVGLQRIVKHIVKRAAVNFLVASATRKLMAGEKAADIALPTDLPTLRNASVAWLLDAYNYLKARPDIVKKAWAKCETKGWSLSYESLTSKAARRRLEEVISTNPQFTAEFATLGVVTGILDGEEEAFDSHDDDLSVDLNIIAELCTSKAPSAQSQQSQPDGSANHLDLVAYAADIDVGSDDEFVGTHGQEDFEEQDDGKCSIR